MKKLVATAVIIASACGVFGGREILAENTTSHAVKKGDTLWDLSEGYLNNPLLWPKIWRVNPWIANPHWIWPGQIVKIPGLGDAPDMEASPDAVVGPVDTGNSALAMAGLASSSEPLPLIMVKKELPPAVAETGPGQTEDPARYYNQGIGMITYDIPNQGRILHTEQGWKSAALGETILVSVPGAQVGQRFGVYRDMGKVKPLTYFGKSPGHLLADVAIVEVVASDAIKQQVVILRSFTEVKSDDLLGPVPELPTISAKPARAKVSFDNGTVVAFHSMREFAGPDEIVYLNIGANQGLAPGDLLSVAGTDQTAGRTSGEIMILRVAENTAAAVVTRASAHEVQRGDVIGQPVL